MFYNHDRNDRLFWALSGFSGCIFLHSSLLNEDIFSQAYEICHKIQHLIQTSYWATTKNNIFAD